MHHSGSSFNHLLHSELPNFGSIQIANESSISHVFSPHADRRVSFHKKIPILTLIYRISIICSFGDQMFYLVYSLISILGLILLGSLYLVSMFLPHKNHISAARYLFFHTSFIIVLKVSLIFLVKYQYMIIVMSTTKYKDKFLSWNFEDKLDFTKIRKIANLDI